jgi:hypothetical protein
MTDLAPGPVVAAPPCQHPHAVRVDNLLDPKAPPWAYLCPECGEQLEESFGRLMRSCCGTPPGDDHWHNCPHAKEEAA